MQVTRYNNQHIIHVAHDGVYLQDHTVSQPIKPQLGHLPPSFVGNAAKHNTRFGERKDTYKILVETRGKETTWKT